jgi:thioredoxin reductase (NADPH)
MQEAAKAEAKIKFLWNAIVMAVNEPAAGRVTSVTVKDVKTGKTCDVACSGFFVAVGHEPNTSVFKGKLKLDGNGYIVTTPGSTATSVNGVFAAGDVADPKYRQAATAVGTGCMAAIEAERWLAR